MKYSMSYEEQVVLDDGTLLRLRAIQPADKSALREGFGQLSGESRRRRFLTPKSGLTDRELRYFTECDGVNHYAIVASVETGGNNSPEGVGVVRIVRTEDDPATAELAIVVVDSWHRRGIGRQLLESIVAAAAERDISKICATALTENEQARGLLEQHADGVEIGPAEQGVLRFTLTVPPANRRDALHQMITLLRRVALAHGSEDRADNSDEDR